MLRKAIICAAASVALAGPALAGLVGSAPPGFSFTGTWSTFVSSTDGRVTSDLTNLVDGFGDPVTPGNTSIAGLTIPSFGPPVGATLSGVGTLKTGDFNGRHAVDDDGEPIPDGAFIEGGTSPSSFVIQFSTAIRAFAFWGTDIGDFGPNCSDSGDSNCLGDNSAAAFSVHLYAGNEDLGVFAMSGSATQSAADFYGILSNNKAFDRVEISNLTTTDGQGFSRFTTASRVVDDGDNNVPEPGILALVGVGLLGLRRWRKA